MLAVDEVEVSWGKGVSTDDRTPRIRRQQPHNPRHTNDSMIPPQPRPAINKRNTATGQGYYNGAGALCQGRRCTFRRLHGGLGTESCLHTGGSREPPYSATNPRIAWPRDRMTYRSVSEAPYSSDLQPPFGLCDCRLAEPRGRGGVRLTRSRLCFVHTLDREGGLIHVCTQRCAIQKFNWE